MKKVFVLLVSIMIFSTSSICNASWWHDFTHGEGRYSGYKDYIPQPDENPYGDNGESGYDGNPESLLPPSLAPQY